MWGIAFSHMWNQLPILPYICIARNPFQECAIVTLPSCFCCQLLFVGAQPSTQETCLAHPLYVTTHAWSADQGTWCGYNLWLNSKSVGNYVSWMICWILSGEGKNCRCLKDVRDWGGQASGLNIRSKPWWPCCHHGTETNHFHLCIFV